MSHTNNYIKKFASKKLEKESIYSLKTYVEKLEVVHFLILLILIKMSISTLQAFRTLSIRIVKNECGKRHFCNNNVPHDLLTPWNAVLEFLSQVDIPCVESPNLFANSESNKSTLGDGNFLRTFNKKYPFVQPLFCEAKKLCHPVGTFATAPSYEYLVLPVTILLTGSVFGQHGITKFQSKQVALSQAALSLYLSQRIHATVQNEKTCSCEINSSSSYDCREKRLSVRQRQAISKGNKIATLIGDLFITEMYAQLSQVENNQVVTIMSDLLAGSSEENFVEMDSAAISHGNQISTKTGHEIKNEDLLDSPFQSEKALNMTFSQALRASSMINNDMYEKQTKLQNLGFIVGSLYYDHRKYLCSPSSYWKLPKNPRENDIDYLNLKKCHDKVQVIINDLFESETPVHHALTNLVNFLVKR